MKTAQINYDIEKHQILITILDKEIWNAAIEAAAELMDKDEELITATEIRKLKK